MAVRRKAIFKKAVSRKLAEKKYENAKKRLDDAFQGIKKRPGRIDLDPREWNGGFNQPPVQQLQPRPGMIDLDPREWNGGFDQPPTQQFEDIFKDRANSLKKQEFSKIQELLKQRQFQRPQPGGPDNGMIHLDPREWGGGGGFNPEPTTPQPLPQMPEQFAGLRDKFAGGLPQLPPRQKFDRIMQPLKPTHGGGGGGGIQLDPREWGGSGGFNQMMPKMPNPPMKRQQPNPGLGGGMPIQPPQGPKQMPMPNPRRGLIPRPQDPRYKLM